MSPLWRQEALPPVWIMNSDPTLFAIDHHGPDDDPELGTVKRWFLSRPDLDIRFGEVFRQAFDEVLDGQRTGRFDIEALDKTEKTYLGTKVEIICRATFALSRGQAMDYSVEGVEVDAKFSLQYGSWMVPQEAIGHLCLLLTADDRSSGFSVGLVRIRDDILTRGGNQDRKRSISAQGRSAIHWLVRNGELPVNALLHMEEAMRDRILSNARSGQQRVNQLFREVQQRMINRETVVTVGKQLDAPKRVRDARTHLHREGILVLGHQEDHPKIAFDLGLPLSTKGSWLAVRVVPQPPGDDRPTTVIANRAYVIAREDEPAQPGPASY